MAARLGTLISLLAITMIPAIGAAIAEETAVPDGTWSSVVRSGFDVAAMTVGDVRLSLYCLNGEPAFSYDAPKGGGGGGPIPESGDATFRATFPETSLTFRGVVSTSSRTTITAYSVSALPQEILDHPEPFDLDILVDGVRTGGKRVPNYGSNVAVPRALAECWSPAAPDTVEEDKPSHDMGESEPDTPWLYQERESEMGDAPTRTIAVISSDDQLGTFFLSASCFENSTSILFRGDEQIVGKNDVTFSARLRFDQEPAKKFKFDVSSDNTAFGYFRGDKSIPLIKSMFGHDALLLELTPVGGEKTVLHFSISRLEEAVTVIREACHW